MDWTLITNALGLAWQSAIPFVLLALAGALVAGIFQAATQIQDDAVSFTGKLFAVVLAIYLFGAHASTSVIEFAQRVWGGTEFYH